MTRSQRRDLSSKPTPVAFHPWSLPAERPQTSHVTRARDQTGYGEQLRTIDPIYHRRQKRGRSARTRNAESTPLRGTPFTLPCSGPNATAERAASPVGSPRAAREQVGGRMVAFVYTSRPRLVCHLCANSAEQGQPHGKSPHQLSDRS